MSYNILKNEPHIHGKVFRRQFLLDNNIRWLDNLYHNDAVFFTPLCKGCANPNKIVYI